MVVLGIIATLAGAVLGTRFKVLILVPAVTLAMVTILATAAIASLSLAWAALAFVLASTALQLGYLGGMATRHVMAVARAGRLREAWHAQRVRVTAGGAR
jgi:hypothetical protein